MKKIVLFKGGIETLEFFSYQLEDTFFKLGYEVLIFDLLNEEISMMELIGFCEENNTVMVTFNFTGISGEGIFINADGKLFWDEKKIPCINIVVDHPFYYHELLRRVPVMYHQICIDRFHLSYMKRYFPEIMMEPFLPLAGTELNPFDTYQPLEERQMDIIFTGNYTPPVNFERYITRIDNDYTAFYYSIIQALIADPELTMENTFKTYLIKEMGPMSDGDLAKCMEKMIFIDLYVRFYFRGLAVKTLVDSGFKVHVFGKGWDLLDCKHHENIVEGGGVNSYTCLQKISQAKISLNVMPWFKDGAHDRIFNSMLNGALCLSDSSIYLREQLQDGKDIKFYSLSHMDELPFIVSELLTHQETMKEIIASGYQKAKEFHTWECRAMELDKIIKEL